MILDAAKCQMATPFRFPNAPSRRIGTKGGCGYRGSTQTNITQFKDAKAPFFIGNQRRDRATIMVAAKPPAF